MKDLAVVDSIEGNSANFDVNCETDQASSLHSLSSGLIIHRTSQVNQQVASDAITFSSDLTTYMNSMVGGKIYTKLFAQELSGDMRLHWLVHLHNPMDYRLLLDMVDHDKVFQEIFESDRLPERGGGNWERMFLQGSFHESVLLPQHGFARHTMGAVLTESFVPPALHQIEHYQPGMLNSLNAETVILREYRARYAARDLARYFLSQFQALLNRKCREWVTCAQFEEIWGCQDRLLLLLHLRTKESYAKLIEFEHSDPEIQAMKCQERVNLGGERLTWEGLFEDGAPTDYLFSPIRD